MHFTGLFYGVKSLDIGAVRDGWNWRDLPIVNNLKDLLETFANGGFDYRWQAVKQLAALGESVVPHLVELLQTQADDVELHWFTVQVLGGIPCASSILALAHVLETAEDEEVSWQAAQQMAAMGGEALSLLSQELYNPKTRAHSIRALAQVRHPDVCPILLEIAQDRAEPQREIVLEALDQFHEPAVLPIFLDGLTDARAGVRKVAIAALGVRQDEYPVGALVAHLVPLLADESPAVVEADIRALSRLGTPEAITALYEVARSTRRSLVERGLSIDALGWIGSRASVHKLAELWPLEMSPAPNSAMLCQKLVQAGAKAQGEAAQRFMTEQLLNWLVSLPMGQSPTLKASMALAVGQLGQQQAIAPLIQQLADPDYGVRLHVIAALKQIDPAVSHQEIQRQADHHTEPDALATGLAIALQEW